MDSSRFFHHGIYGISMKNNHILLVLKSRGPYTGAWDLPGGKPELGESLEQTLYREVYEETGIKIATSRPYAYMSICLEYKDNDKIISLHHGGHIFFIESFDECEFKVNVGKEDVHTARWIAMNATHTIRLSPFAQQAIKKIEKELVD